MKKILLGIAILFTYATQAQLNYKPGLSFNGTTPYTAIGTNGSAITVANNDDANSAPQNIGFTFSYNGQNFTQFVLNTNGFIKLGSTAPSGTAIFGATSTDITGSILISSYPANSNSIAVFNHDLTGTANTEYRVYTSGVAPNRVCTIEWKAVTEKTATAQMSSMDFQVKLYETSNTIDFVYANFTSSGNASTFKAAAVGLVGTDNSNVNAVYVLKASANAWSTATFSTTPTNAAPNGFQGMNFRNVQMADNGRTFRFLQALQNDVAVTNVYALGKTGQNVSSVVRARIINNGMTAKTNLVATLKVLGANSLTTTATIPSLASGASTVVAFPGIAVGNLGYDTLVVTVPNDDFSDDNTDTTNWDVTTHETGYILGTTPTNGVNIGANGILAAKLKVPYGNTVSQIKFIVNGVGGNTYDALIYDNSGTGGTPGAAPLWTLTGQTTVAGLNTVTVPNIAVNDTFYVAIRQTGAAIALGYLTEAPLRPNSFFLFSGAGPWFDLSGNAANSFRVMIDAVTTNALPVTLVDFKGERKADANLLQWTTASEINNSGFELLRSADGRNFSSIATIASKATNGYSNSVLNYSFADVKGLAGNNYYRLKQTDKDGKSTLSSVVLIKASKVAGLAISAIYPNPTKNELNVSLNSGVNEKVSIAIINNEGKTVKLINTAVVTGDNIFNINVSELAAGTYFIKASSGNSIQTTQFVKQ